VRIPVPGRWILLLAAGVAAIIIRCWVVWLHRAPSSTEQETAPDIETSGDSGSNEADRATLASTFEIATKKVELAELSGSPPAAAQQGTQGVESFSDDFSSANLDKKKWSITRKNDFAEFAVDTIKADGGNGRLRLRCGTIGTDDATVKVLGVASKQPLDLSGRKRLALDFDWNDQSNGCYLTGGFYLCPALTDGNPGDEADWLRIEYVGVPPGKKGRAAIWLKKGGKTRWLYDEGWPRRRNGRELGVQHVEVFFQGGSWRVLENGRLLYDSQGRKLPFREAHLYLQMSSHSNYPPREVFFDNVAFGPVRESSAEPVGAETPPKHESTAAKENTAFHVERARAHAARGEWAEAEDAYEHALRLEAEAEGRWGLHRELARVCQERGWREKRLEHLGLAADLCTDPQVRSELRSEIARMHCEAGHHKEAEAVHRQIVADAPPERRQQAVEQLWNLQRRTGRLRERIEELERTAAANPKNETPLRSLSYIHSCITRNPTREAEALQKLVALRPDDLALLRRLAAVSERSHQRETVLESYEKLCERDPRNRAFYCERASTFCRNEGDRDLAAKWAEAIFGQDEESHSLRASAARQFKRLQFRDRAEKEYQKAIQLAPEGPVRERYSLEFASLLLEIGKRDRAADTCAPIATASKSAANRNQASLLLQQIRAGSATTGK